MELGQRCSEQLLVSRVQTHVRLQAHTTHHDNTHVTAVSLRWWWRWGRGGFSPTSLVSESVRRLLRGAWTTTESGRTSLGGSLTPVPTTQSLPTTVPSPSTAATIRSHETGECAHGTTRTRTEG